MRLDRGVALSGLAAALLAVASFLWGSTGPQETARRLMLEAKTPAPVSSIASSRFESTPAQLASDIEGAQRAIASQIGQPPLSGPIGERPAFVSDLEWRIFQGVAHTHDDPGQELILLVNRIRFIRLESLWRSIRTDGRDPVLRQQLAQQLLDEIPGRVQARQFDLAQAQSLQQQLLEDLVNDPVERTRRASEESLRLGGTARLE